MKVRFVKTKIRRCLGIFQEEHCQILVESPERFCEACKKRNKNLNYGGKRARGRGGRLGYLSKETS